jgi:hypothetical protein
MKKQAAAFIFFILVSSQISQQQPADQTTNKMSKPLVSQKTVKKSRTNIDIVKEFQKYGVRIKWSKEKQTIFIYDSNSKDQFATAGKASRQLYYLHRIAYYKKFKFRHCFYWVAYRKRYFYFPWTWFVKYTKLRTGREKAVKLISLFD